MLKTEMRNPHTMHIDTMTPEEMVRVIQQENKNAVNAIDAVLPRIAEAIEAVSARMREGGRLFYVGCGTSGRLGVLDASECPPTYGVSRDTVIGVIAGGYGALVRAVEGAEDDHAAGYRDLAEYRLTDRDSVVGISVAGGADYVLGAFTLAEEVGALTVGLTSNQGSPIDLRAEIAISPDTGAEAVTGSTRMKAGSAHKMILNMLSTAVMIRLGHVYENLMINLRPSNKKLRARMISIVSDITGESRERAESLLEENGFVIRDAVTAYRREN